MVRSHSGPDPCYYRAAAAEQISGLNEAIVSDVAGADVVLMKTKPRVTRQPTTINYTLVCSYTLRLRQGHSRAHAPHLPTRRQIQDGTTRTFIFMQHCDALCKFNTQNLILGLRNRDRKVIQKRGIVRHLIMSRSTCTHTHAPASVVFENGPVGLSGHVDSSFCETETKHLLCMASAPLHTCFP